MSGLEIAVKLRLIASQLRGAYHTLLAEDISGRIQGKIMPGSEKGTAVW